MNSPAVGRGSGDLGRTKTIETARTWPDKIEVVAHFGGRKRVAVEIEREAFFGENAAEHLHSIVNRLRVGVAT